MKMQSTQKFVTTAFGVVATLLAANANATLMLAEGVFGGSGDVENVLYPNPGPVDLTVQGQLNSSEELVRFTSDENI